MQHAMIPNPNSVAEAFLWLFAFAILLGVSCIVYILIASWCDRRRHRPHILKRKK